MQKIYLTKTGKQLMSKLLEGETTASFSKVATSSDTYSEQDIENIENLDNIKQEVLISNVERKDAETIELTARVTNTELKEGYYINTIAIYARSNEKEFIYAVAVDNETPDYLEAFNNANIEAIAYTINVKTGDTANVTLTIEPEAFVTKKQLEDRIDSIVNVFAKGPGIEFSVSNGILCVTYDDGTEEGAD